jgi:hypothetical protein
MNNIRQIKVILYRLKKDYGQVISLLSTINISQNVQTGAIIRNERVVTVRKAIILDTKMSRDFAYDLSFIAANKNFTYGGMFDTSTRLIIVDKADLPKDYIPTIDDRAIFDGERYQMGPMGSTVYNLGYIFTLKHLESQKTENVIDQKIGQSLSTEQGVSHA